MYLLIHSDRIIYGGFAGDDDQCSKEVYSEGVKLTWDEAQQACQKRGGYLGNFGSAKYKTVWTGYKRWFLDDSCTLFQ